MEREYEIFEQLPDGSPVWRGHASGLPSVRMKLQELARTTPNECFAMYLPTKEVVARLNVKGVRAGSEKRLIFQISYDSKRAAERTQILRMCGYDVLSVIGNESAKMILGMSQRCDLFILGARIESIDARQIDQIDGAVAGETRAAGAMLNRDARKIRDLLAHPGQAIE